MSFWVALRGRLRDDPEEIDSNEPERVAAFVIIDAHEGAFAGHYFELNNVPTCEVVVRGRAASAVLSDGIRQGDAIVALGLMTFTLPLDSASDMDLVAVTVEAYAVGRDLAAG